MSDRPETGPMKFGDDWAGVFIRGDNAAYIAMCLQSLREELKEKGVVVDSMGVIGLENAIKLLDSSNECEGLPDDAQLMKDFAVCKK